MKRSLAAVALALACGACASPPPPVHAGDVCFRCRRTISDVRLAAQTVDSQGRAFPFKTAGCLATYLREHPDVKDMPWVTDYRTGRVISAARASYVATMIGEGRDRARDYLAFSADAEAQAVASRDGTAVLEWKQVLAGN
jgi:hypothetical protein